MAITRRAIAALPALALAARARAAAPVRVGTLRFGSLAWELDVMSRHGLVQGFALETVEHASAPASQVALQSGQVDIVLQDWLWVSRQRSGGADWTAAPVPAALGAVMVPPASPLRQLDDLRGKRLGVAGGPIDKSWLLLLLYARRVAHIDLRRELEISYGAPPLLAEQLRAGRLDAALTYWPFAARAEAQDLTAMLEMADVLAALSLPRDMPMLAFAFGERWARRESDALAAFLAAARDARAILARSDAEWQAIAPLTGAQNPAELDRLRARYRSGLPGAWDPAKADAAARLFGLLAAEGGADLVGPATQLAPGIFWPGA